MVKMKKFSAWLLAIAAAFVVSVVGGAVAQATTYPVEVKHAQGTVKLEKEPERIVVLDYGALDTLDSLGLGDKIVGIVEGTYPENLKKYESVEKVGTAKEPNLEAIAKLNPDLLVIGNRYSDKYQDLSKLYPTLDASVEWKDLDKSSYTENVKKAIEAIGQATNAEEAAKEQIAAIDKKVEEYKGKGKGKALVVMTNGGEISLHSKESRWAPIFEVFGFEDVAPAKQDEGHKGEKVSFETIQEINPDWIFVVDRDKAVGKEDNGQPAEKVMDNDLVKQTNAAKEGHIVYLSATEWYAIMSGAHNYQHILDEVAQAIK